MSAVISGYLPDCALSALKEAQFLPFSSALPPFVGKNELVWAFRSVWLF